MNRVESHGFRAGGHGRSKQGPPIANSWVDSFPITTAPASFRSFVTVASSVATLSMRIRECAVVGTPA